MNKKLIALGLVSLLWALPLVMTGVNQVIGVITHEGFGEYVMAGLEGALFAATCGRYGWLDEGSPTQIIEACNVVGYSFGLVGVLFVWTRLLRLALVGRDDASS